MDTQSWQAVQCEVKLRALNDPGGVMATARAGFFFSSLTDSPPSTFFSSAFIAVAVANMAVADKKARRVSLIDVAETSSFIDVWIETFVFLCV